MNDAWFATGRRAARGTLSFVPEFSVPSLNLLRRERRLPPRRLRFMGETDDDYLAIGDQLADTLELHGELRPDSSVLDIGCGYGRLPHALDRRGFEGSYLGLDVLAPHVSWCERNLGSARYRFRHVDVHNGRYNPAGGRPADAVRLDEEGQFDVVALFSVFPHMWPDEVRAYLRLIASCLAPGGVAVVTFFLLDEEQRRLAQAGAARLTFPHEHSPVCRYESRADPLHHVGYERDWVVTEAALAGLALTRPPVPGTWSGRPVDPTERPGYQDAVTFARARQ
jgi:SAM-dependent methyltransferase